MDRKVRIDYFKYEFNKDKPSASPVWFWEIVRKDGIKVNMEDGSFVLSSNGHDVEIRPGDYIMKTNGDHLGKLELIYEEE